MTKVTLSGNAYELEKQESVLLGLERHGVSIPSSCRSGVCQTCLLLAVKGEVPADAQVGLKPTLQKQGYFLACMCKPESSLEISIPGEDVRPRYQAKLLEKDFLGEDIFRLRLSRPDDFEYYPGQFISVHRPDGLIRSYSLASVTDEGFLELHIRHLPDGQMSGWLKDSIHPGDAVEIEPALGDCFYLQDDPTKNILLIGTGTGLSPLYGIIRDALNKGHSGDIHLYHGSQTDKGIYLQHELQDLAEQNHNFHYHPCVSGNSDSSYNHGRANDVALREHPDLKGWNVYLCGHPDMVSATAKKSFLAGASFKDIYSDPFTIAEQPPRESIDRD